MTTTHPEEVFEYNCSIGFGSDEESANIVYQTIIVDHELSTKVKRNINLHSSSEDGSHHLIINFTSSDARQLRSSVKGTLDTIHLSIETLTKFVEQ
ncbi:hypothetical protein FDP41_000616 [Naegleria fowleri]|uniref:Transcription factor Pcc1 n=1 Tax=Naegleria fowleri TaxID=5763 RepID=A0A6A5C2S9_NAEFO|nr:uncharacterized protein FDP41_001423 [Naegleria fowleri]XP_044569430.1 uncharacterized protein FDP41_000616 [Naegleria fowleri]KAF0979559.1 hypothetical protein FDP41_001423 [Naegleria fowleri]KAF0984717.1 hypothetical protein FDP41_000616 [Naegleria fowleri]